MPIYKRSFTTSLKRKTSIQQIAGLESAVILVVKTLKGEIGENAIHFDMMNDTFRDSNSKTIILSFDSSLDEMKEFAEFLGLKSDVAMIDKDEFPELKLVGKNTHALYKFWNKEFKKIKVNPSDEDFVKLNETLNKLHVIKKEEDYKKELIARTMVIPLSKKEIKMRDKIVKKNAKRNKKKFK